MTTARDIAAVVGVSISTVGRALADDPRISAETRQKVKKAAALVGYAGNQPARMMRGSASKLIGLVLPDVHNDFYAGIAQALSLTCDREGYQIVLAITGDNRDLEAKHVAELARARAAGIIIVPTASPRRNTGRLLQGLPHVQLLRQAACLEGKYFGTDDAVAIGAAARHLIELGHERVAYVGGMTALSTGAQRLLGFRETISAAGLDVDPAMECLGPTTAAFGSRSVDQLLSRDHPPTAIMTGSAHITIGVIDAVERAGLVVPGNLSLIGFGDPEWFQWWRGGLTTVRPPIEELATTCGLWFLHQLRSGKIMDSPVPGQGSIVRSALVMRSTTAPPTP